MEYKTLLIIDDEPAILEMLSQHLKESHFEVYCASNLDEATTLVQQKTIHMVLLDIILKQQRGWDFLHTLAKLPHEPQVVLMTGELSLNLFESPLKQKIKVFLKPFSLDQLTRYLNSLL
jgi:DNA-binding NtrC family response regulator